MALQLAKDMDRLSLLSKTPVSWLHEVCTRNNVTPKYDLLQVEGAIHEPIFQYRLTLEFNGKIYEESGSGRSKKEAKHNTARAMLRSMEVVAPHELFELGDTSVVPAIEAGDGACSEAGDGDSGANPVGILQELCMKMKYPPPTYEVDSEEGLPHERLFAIACCVGEQFVEIGKGKSKKLAKRVSAHNMAQRLRSLPMETSNSRVYQDDDDIIIERIRSGMSDKKSKKAKWKKAKSGSSVRSSGEASCQAYEYKSMTGPVVDLLRDPNHVLAPNEVVPFIRRLEKEQNFKAMYIDSDELSANGEYQCMVQLTLDPPLVLIGEADTKAQAKRAAAFDVVHFFTQMVRIRQKRNVEVVIEEQVESVNTADAD